MDCINEENKLSIIIGDMNLNKMIYNNPDYPYKKLRDMLLDAVERNDLKVSNLGPTYLSKSNGCQSEIDHVYYNANMHNEIKIYSDDCAASDHIPSIVEINLMKAKVFKNKPKYKVIRSYKNFSQEKFNSDLAQKEWEQLWGEDDCNVMVEITFKFLSEVFEENAPLKKLKFTPIIFLVYPKMLKLSLKKGIKLGETVVRNINYSVIRQIS